MYSQIVLICSFLLRSTEVVAVIFFVILVLGVKCIIFPPLAFARARISLATGTGYVSVVGSVGLLDYVSFIFTHQTLPHLWFLKVTSLNSVVKLT